MKDLDPQFARKTSSITTDGASTNVGRIKGACTLLARQAPHLKVIHCVNHQLNLLLNNIFQESTKWPKFVKLIRKVASKIRNSTALLGLFHNPPPEYVSIRWSSITRFIDWLSANLDTVIDNIEVSFLIT